jgi:uncharacterized protein YlxW (UPF0749 family)
MFNSILDFLFGIAMFLMFISTMSLNFRSSSDARRQEQRANQLQNALEQRENQLRRLVTRLRQLEQQLQQLQQLGTSTAASNRRLRLDEKGNLREE